MRIEAGMNLWALAERMGHVADLGDATVMRDALLNSKYNGQNTDDIPEQEWLQLVNEACPNDVKQRTEISPEE